LKPANSSLLTDDSVTGIEGVEDSLDPAVGFTLGDGPLFAAVYQQLVEFNGSNANLAVPALASSFTASSSALNFTFVMRPMVTFNNGDPTTAADAWFSLARQLLIGQGPGVSNYVQLLFPANYSSIGFSSPWGIGNALNAATNSNTYNNATKAADALANMLSNFNPSNSTQAAVMSYSNQALVLVNSTTFQMNLLKPYVFFPLDIAAWWGTVQDPTFIDAHGGVQPNSVNSYLADNPEPTTGPYYVKSITPGTQAVIVKNPTYWGGNMSGLAPNLQAATISTIVINYGLSDNARQENFVSNLDQISYVSQSEIKGLESGYPSGYNPSQYLINEGPNYGELWISFNTQEYPTNITALRQALVHSVNLTTIDSSVCLNLCENYVGPISPYFTNFYNPANLPVYSYNLTLAEQDINQSGYQGNFFVTLPNGTQLGDPNGSPLPAQTLWTVSPITSFTSAEFSVIQAGWQQIGVAVALNSESPGALLNKMTTVQGTPQIFDGAWYPDWPDPIYQQMVSMTGPSYGIGGNFAWYNDTTLNNLYLTLPFTTNHTAQVAGVTEAYQQIYNDAPYLWLPNTDTYFFIQPYIQGFVFNILFSYYYQAMSYS
jgi:peptide/nickel transport system substrate-binding protein